MSSRSRNLAMGLLWVLAAFVVLIPTMGSSSGMTRSHHGLYHSASIYQIHNGIVPPTNPLSMEQPAFSYWAWYLGMAEGMELLGVTPFEAAILSNAVALALLWTGIWFGALLFRTGALPRFAFCLLPLFLLKPHAWGVQAWALGTPRIDVVGKFLNFSSFPLGLGLFAVLIPLALRKPRNIAGNAILCGVVSAALSFLHPTSSIAVFLFAWVGIAVHGSEWLRKKTPLAPMSGYVAILVGFASAFPYMNGLRQALGGRTTVLTSLPEIVDNLRTAGLSLLLPTMILLFAVTRLRALDCRGHILALTSAALLVGSILIEIPGDNQYKLNLLLAVSSTFLLCASLPHDPDRRSHRSLARYGSLASLVLAAASSLHSFRGYEDYPWFGKNLFVYDGTAVDLNAEFGGDETRHRQEALLWIRQNTPPTAYVLTRPLNMNEMLLPVIAQRRAVAARGRSDLHLGFPHQRELLQRSHRLAEDLARGTDPTRSLRRLRKLPLDWPNQLYIFGVNGASRSLDEIRAALARHDSPVEPVFVNSGFVVYMTPMTEGEGG